MNAHQIIIAMDALGLLIVGVTLAIILWYRPKIDRHLDATHPIPPVEELRHAIEDSADETAAILREESERTRTAIDDAAEATDLAHGKMHENLKTVAGRTQWLVANKMAEELAAAKRAKANPVPKPPTQEENDHG